MTQTDLTTQEVELILGSHTDLASQPAAALGATLLSHSAAWSGSLPSHASHSTGVPSMQFFYHCTQHCSHALHHLPQTPEHTLAF